MWLKVTPCSVTPAFGCLGVTSFLHVLFYWDTVIVDIVHNMFIGNLLCFSHSTVTPEDYTPAGPLILTFMTGAEDESQQCGNITIVADGEAEGDGETISMFTIPAANYTLVSPGNAIVMINDIDDGR